MTQNGFARDHVGGGGWRTSLIHAIGLSAVLLALPTLASAHILDEYEQATRIALATDHVTLKLRLTAGVEIASRVFALIDTNKDGQVSTAEGRAYGQRWLRTATLTVDGRSPTLTLVRAEVPPLSEMKTGEAPIYLEFKAKVAAGTPGAHWLTYENQHQPKISTYLVNALRPADSAIVIKGQQRDRLQHGIRLDYTVAASPAGPATTVGAR
jgi:nickel/cobalt transporter (NicO) family protein